jgi:phosphoribosyl-AMP cyclohydrolase / phosphoribosyl-ATP pyrophosphohydrolase
MTNRILSDAKALDTLRFDDRGLIPVVTQEVSSQAVLMMAWANRDSLELTLRTGFMHYWSRSRGALWKKGETSGHLQAIVSLHADCDGDTVLARVRAEGPACHTGEETCFGGLPASAPDPGVLAELGVILEARMRDLPEGSWTTRLLSDENLRLKKLGEESVELVAALLRNDGRAPEEAADLVYHTLVALLAGGHKLDELWTELARRLPESSQRRVP